MYKCRYVIDFQPITGYSSDVFIRQSKCFGAQLKLVILTEYSQLFYIISEYF